MYYILRTAGHRATQTKVWNTADCRAKRTKRVSGLVGYFVQTWPDSKCSHTVQFLDCVQRLELTLQSLSPVLARYDPFGVDVPLNFDNTHSVTVQISDMRHPHYYVSTDYVHISYNLIHVICKSLWYLPLQFIQIKMWQCYWTLHIASCIYISPFVHFPINV